MVQNPVAPRNEEPRGPGFSVRVSADLAKQCPTLVPEDLQCQLRKGPDQLKIHPNCNPARANHDKKCTYTVGGFPTALRFKSFGNTLVNCTTSLLERVFYHEIAGVFIKPEEPRYGLVESLLSRFKRQLLFKVGNYTPVERHEYVQNTYKGQRLLLYTKAVEKLDRRGLLKSDSHLGSFIKWEKLPVTKKRTVPRLIQPRAPAYNVELGRYLHPIEHSMYRGINRVFGHTVVMKGLNALQQGACFHKAWTKFQRPCAMMLDASRFDQHITSSLLKWEHSIYNSAFSSDPVLACLLKWQLRNKGFMRSDDGALLKYTRVGGRCSGDMNTALGNILVMCGIVYSFLEVYGARNVQVLDAGDDCVIIGESEVIKRLEKSVDPYFLKFGLIMKVEPLVYTLEHVSFCQTQPVNDGTSWRMVRDPRTSLSKDVTILYADHVKDLTNHCIAIGDCGLALTGGMPVLQEYYRALGAGRARSKPVDDRLLGTGFFRLAAGMSEKYRVVTDTARVSFATAFGITPDLQRALELNYAMCQVTPADPVVGGEVDRVDIGLGSL